jgi:hypothetical protein
MNAKYIIVVALAAWAGMVTTRFASAADESTTQPATQNSGAPGDDMPASAGPAVSDPVGRVGGGVRGTHSPSDPAFWISVLAPTNVGQTSTPSPALVFYLSKPTEDRVIVTVTELRNPQVPAVLSWSSDGSVPAGLHEIDLARMGATLKPKVIYRWTAAVRLEEENPATQIFDAGLIRYVPPADQTTPAPATPTATPTATPSSRMTAYGSQYFYDSVAAGYDAILTPDGDRIAARSQFTTILEQAQIKDVSLDVANPPENKAADDANAK